MPPSARNATKQQYLLTAALRIHTQLLVRPKLTVASSSASAPAMIHMLRHHRLCTPECLGDKNGKVAMPPNLHGGEASASLIRRDRKRRWGKRRQLFQRAALPRAPRWGGAVPPTTISAHPVAVPSSIRRSGSASGPARKGASIRHSQAVGGPCGLLADCKQHCSVSCAPGAWKGRRK